MKLTAPDRASLKNRYLSQWERFGYSPKSLGWDKGKQDLRFEILTSFFDLNKKSVLDVGCGFGDLNRALRRKYRGHRYLGIDLCEDFVAQGSELFANRNTRFICGDFLATPFRGRFDAVLGSGIFNIKLAESDGYSMIQSTLAKALSLCREGIAFDFLSDKVDFSYAHSFNASPEKVLAMAYQLSRNVILRNDYMPFEFSIAIFKDDTFLKSDTIFKKFKRDHRACCLAPR